MSNSVTSDTITKLDYITVESISPLIADFIADTTFGYIPFDVQFTDLSIGDITDWEWDFDNDGEIDSYEQNPTHFLPKLVCFL